MYPFAAIAYTIAEDENGLIPEERKVITNQREFDEFLLKYMNNGIKYEDLSPEEWAVFKNQK